MKFDCTMEGDLVAIGFNFNEDTAHRTFSPVIRVGCTAADARKKFGPEFERIAFGTLKKDSNDFGYRSMTPAIVCEIHKLTICGADAGAVQPEIIKIKPVEGKCEVAVDIRLPINMKARKSLAGAVAMEFGAVIEVDLESSQKGFDFTNPATAKANGPFGNPKQVATDGGGTEADLPPPPAPAAA